MTKTLPLLLAATLAALPATAQQPHDGVNVGKASSLRKLVPADQLEQASAQQYGQLKQQAAAQGALAPEANPQLQRLRGIARRILPFAPRFNSRAERWQWEVNLIGSKELNAFCMPGGKIAFYTGLIDNLKLTDDEIAIVMGHEIAHALREHARERVAKTQLTNIGASVIGSFFGNSKYSGLAQWGIQSSADLLKLSFSREDETEADVVGLDLSARAGYDPRAGITLWQKMGAASKGRQFQWLSTHPAGDNRIKEIERHLPEVMPLYEAAKQRY